MKQFRIFSDYRLQGYCVHCGEVIQEGEDSREHSPTKSLLNEPYPQELPTVPVHRKCNIGYSQDEEYVGAFLASVICGSTDPDPEQFPAAARTLRHSQPLRRRIERSRQEQGSLWGPSEIWWIPEMERVNRVVVKNARCHVFFELDELVPEDPLLADIRPWRNLSLEEREQFQSGPQSSLWPEAGSRMMQRIAFGALQPGGWVEVQPDVYRYAVCQTDGGTVVRIVLREYLVAEICW